ncbi:oligosaccharide flippase family protein [Alteromonas aestuariivivens]|uniref:oligosaccharide flippase family protein n=1 Tax=Alteromonas aestuariivivens TaxID=1938339 RepID=UPI0015F27A3E|nr:oligosaccharide flippase family protein [Alteromonas aestuariivivens]
MPQLKKGLLASILSVAQSFIEKSVGLISTLVLARVLVPEDFGLVAMATIFFGFVSILGQTGGQHYLLRANDINDDMLNTSWTINLALKALIAAVTVVSAPHVADYFGDVRLTQILYFYAFTTVVSGLENPGLNLLRREQHLLPIVINNLCGKVLAVASAISIALIFESYWALVIGQFISILTKVTGSYFVHSHRPRFCLTNMREQFGFSIWLIAQASLGYGRTQLDTFLVASGFSQNQLGQYNVMKYIAFLPNILVLGPATEPLLRQLSSIKDSAEHFRTSLNVSTFTALLIAIPVAVFCYTKSEPLVELLLGNQWVEYAYLFSLFSLLIPAFVAFHQANRLMIIYGHTKYIFIYEIFAFTGIYSTLYLAGLDNLVLFTGIRVSLENVFSFSLLIVTVSAYTGPRNLFRMLLLFIPLILSALFSLEFMALLPDMPDSPVIIELILHGGAYALAYGLFSITYVLMLKKHIGEFSTLYNYAQKIAGALGNKASNKRFSDNRIQAGKQQG